MQVKLPPPMFAVANQRKTPHEMLWCRALPPPSAARGRGAARTLYLCCIECRGDRHGSRANIIGEGRCGAASHWRRSRCRSGAIAVYQAAIAGRRGRCPARKVCRWAGDARRTEAAELLCGVASPDGGGRCNPTGRQRRPPFFLQERGSDARRKVALIPRCPKEDGGAGVGG